MEQGSAEWLAARRHGIGGSEASVLFGCNPYLNEIALWALKTGRVSPQASSIHDTPHLYWGTALEPAVRQGYMDLTGRTVVEGHTMLAHPDVPCLLANTDGTIVDVPGKPGRGVYEGKTASVFARSSWYTEDGEPDIPLHYQVQVQHYLACTGYKWASLAVYFGGHREPLEWFDIERHDRLIEELCRRADRWWQRHVVEDTQPELDDSAQTEAVLRELAPPVTGRIVALPDPFDAVADRIVACDQLIKLGLAERQRCRNLVIAAMGPAEYAQTYTGRGYSHKLEGKNGRVFRLASERTIERALRRAGVSQAELVYVDATLVQHARNIAAINWGMSPTQPGTDNEEDPA